MIVNKPPKQELDDDMVDILEKLNDHCYFTAWSCSGTIKDHPDLNGKLKGGFIKFLGNEIEDEKIQRIHNCAVTFNFDKDITHSISDGFLFEVYEKYEDMLKTDAERIKKWNDFTKLLCSKKKI